MPHADLIDSLIGTYRDLNLKLRPLSEDRLNAKGGGGASLRDLVAEMRNRELVASQQLKLMLLADAAGANMEVVDPRSLDPVDSQRTHTLLSEFGTARESILATVRELPDEDLERELPSANGTTSITAFLKQLIDSDNEDCRKIEQLLA